MTPRLNSVLIERLSEAVVSLNGTGDIVNFNSAARPLLRHCFDLLPKIRQELRALGSERPLSPRPLPLTPRPSHQGMQLETWLCENGTGFLLLFLPAGNAVPQIAPTITTDHDLAFTSLIGSEIRHEIATLQASLAAMSSTATEEMKDFAQSAERFGRLLTVIDLLSDTVQAPAFFESERLSLFAMLTDVLAQLPGAHGDYDINQHLSDGADQQGYLYGHAKWLKAAFRALIEALDANAPTHCQIELRIRQNGSFIVLTGGYCNLKRKAPVSASTMGMHAPHAAKETPERVLKVDAGIRLVIARQIVELHGGQLRIVSTDTDGANVERVEGFTLVLPTSIPTQGRSPTICRQCIYPQQAKSLAQDLARLMPRQPVHAHMSPDELHLLAQLTLNGPLQDATKKTNHHAKNTRR